MNNITPKPPAVRGRPTKAALAKKAPLGRPREDAGRIAEFKQRLLATSGERVIDKIISIAMDDGHTGQMAALKMCIDRVLPVSLFEKGPGSKPQIQINIVNTTLDTEDTTVDIVATEVDND